MYVSRHHEISRSRCFHPLYCTSIEQLGAFIDVCVCVFRDQNHDPTLKIIGNKKFQVACIYSEGDNLLLGVRRGRKIYSPNLFFSL